MRLNLAQALMCPSDLLLLDEPTNHLDLDAIIWLEDWLKRYPGTLLVISHDRDFLDGVVNVDRAHRPEEAAALRRRLLELRGAARADRWCSPRRQLEKQERERAHLQSFIDRFKAKATKARQAQSRMKMLAKMEDLAPLHVSRAVLVRVPRAAARAQPAAGAGGRRDAGYGDKTVLSGHQFLAASRSSATACSASTARASRRSSRPSPASCQPLSGSAIFNKGLQIGYFAQHQVEMLRDDQSPLWHLKRICASNVREQELRNYLGSFNFPGDMATGSIEHFSGGEKARLALALIVWQRPNLLLLDEPTNHLDLETREALTVALAQFEGTLVLVSHDRHLLRATTDQFLIVADGTLRAFDGDLDDYRDSLLQKKPVQEKKVIPKPQKQKAVKSQRPSSPRVQRLEKKMAELNERKAAIEARLADPAVYQDQEGLKALLLDQAYVAKELEQVEGEWLEWADTAP